MTENWRQYRDPLSVPPERCAQCGAPVPNCALTLADGRKFCRSACHEAWMRAAAVLRDDVGRSVAPVAGNVLPTRPDGPWSGNRGAR